MRSSGATRTRHAGLRLLALCGVLLTVVLMGIVTVPGAVPGAAAATAAPKLTVSPTTAAIGQTVQVAGTGFPARGIFQVQVCGQNAVHGSADCAAAAASTIQAEANGNLEVPVAVVMPPTQCPCVVAAFSIRTALNVTAPLTIEGASTSNVPTAPPVVPRSHLVVVQAKFNGSTPVAQWFGFQATRTLDLTVRNSGAAPASDVHLYVSLDSTPVVSTRLATLGAGQTTTYPVPVTIPALSVGNLDLKGRIVTGDGQQVDFSVPFSVWPVGLLVAALLLLQMILLAVRNVARRRYERQNPPGSGGRSGSGGAVERPATDPRGVPVVTPKG